MVSADIGRPGFDKQRAALIVEAPPATVLADDILPADLTDVARAIASGLEINHPNWASCIAIGLSPKASREANELERRQRLTRERSIRWRRQVTSAVVSNQGLTNGVLSRDQLKFHRQPLSRQR